MGVEVIHYQMNLRRVWVAAAQSLEELSEVQRFSVFLYSNEMLAPLGFNGTKRYRSPFALIFVVFPANFPRLWNS